AVPFLIGSLPREAISAWRKAGELDLLMRMSSGAVSLSAARAELTKAQPPSKKRQMRKRTEFPPKEAAYPSAGTGCKSQSRDSGEEQIRGSNCRRPAHAVGSTRSTHRLRAR